MRDDPLRVVKIDEFFPLRIFVQNPQLRVVPILDDLGELVETLELRITLIVGKFLAQQSFSDFEDDALVAHLQNVFDRHLDLAPINASRHDGFGWQIRTVNLVIFDAFEAVRQFAFGVVNAVALDVRERDLVFLGSLRNGKNGRNIDRSMSRRFPSFEQLEGNADDVRVLRRKFVINDAALIGRWIARFVVPLQKIEFSSQRSPGDLFAKQLRAERSQAGDVRHVVRIPTFGQH